MPAKFTLLLNPSQEAGPEGGKIQLHFEELLKSNTTLFVVNKLSFIICFYFYFLFFAVGLHIITTPSNSNSCVALSGRTAC